jgi:haloalkane dehalogenase
LQSFAVTLLVKAYAFIEEATATHPKFKLRPGRKLITAPVRNTVLNEAAQIERVHELEEPRELNWDSIFSGETHATLVYPMFQVSNIMHPTISTEDASYRKRVPVLDTNIAYVDVAEGDPIVFLHGNPTPSHLWRNIIPYLVPFGRCLAPDLVGMGNSGTAPDGSYRFVDHRRYLDAWFEAMELKKDVILVVHDWGSALGLSWAQRYPERIKALVYMEAIVRPFFSWDEWPKATREFFKRQRTSAGEELILQKNLFIEYLLRGLSEDVMEVYRRHYRNPGPSRQPMLTWSKELPIEGHPEDVTQIVDSHSSWLATSPIPKLFINGDPGGFLIGAQREFCRAWPNQQEIIVKGAHFLREDSPAEVGEATARFIAKVLAGQIS